ncbi:453779fa-ed3f-4fdf-beaf-caf21e4ec5ff [Sclerotinia trifoliorum]|uniref:453779fa-ed3f-4fdf-beaf-caf21e4ec5ff n=1 Tax=Sclerotinia trifoliorum TaxID=28548 RepID=A0A8H2ZIU6_9HELO|nr:453779fa-ed3f-4fdf-beaf-caf21e4ec5ff [Sclerotinia trifoliorum]
MSTNTTINLALSSPFHFLPISTITILIILSTYLLLVHFLRFSRRDSMIRKFGYTNRESFNDMTNTDAQKIIIHLGELEFPSLYKMSMQFGLFKTYGIPAISKLLVDTKQFSSKETASKRFADTGILIGEFSSHPPLHPRVLKAISRMNYLHSGYQKAGKISNDDLLYTLSVFITEPINWVNKYEWREFNDMEICAISTFWKGIGDAMEISYHVLPRFNKWKDGIEFYEDIRDWAQEYREKFMLPNPYNKKTADQLVPLLLFLVPKWALPFANDGVGVLMGPRLRKAMMYPEPSPLHQFLILSLLKTRQFFLRYLSLPRPEFMRVREISPTDDKGINERFHSSNYLVHPYYQNPGWWNRWGPMAIFTRIMGGYVPDGREEWKAKGYRFEEVGPRERECKGLEEMRGMEERLERERSGGCLFAFGGGEK